MNQAFQLGTDFLGILDTASKNIVHCGTLTGGPKRAFPFVHTLRHREPNNPPDSMTSGACNLEFRRLLMMDTDQDQIETRQ